MNDDKKLRNLSIFCKILSAPFFVLGVISTLLTLALIYTHYGKPTLNIFIPFVPIIWMNMSLTIFNFVAFWGLWSHQRWIISVFSMTIPTIIFLNIINFSLNPDAFNFTVVTSVLLVITLLTIFLVFMRKFLSGSYFKSNIFITFVIWWVIYLISYLLLSFPSL